MGCRYRQDGGLAFHCLYTLRPLGLTGLAKATFTCHAHRCVFFLYICVRNGSCADCEQLNVKEEGSSSIMCKHCQSMIGTQDATADGWRIRKWGISIASSLPGSPPAPFYSTQKWISARLLYLIENTGVRKFHVHTALAANKALAPIPSLLLWVFTPDLLFSSSIPTPNRLDPTRSVKVFYQKQTWQPIKPGEPESASIEDVEFPVDLYKELDQALQQSRRLLPPTTNKFQGWDVGLLERFEVAEAGMGVGVGVGESDAAENEENDWGIPSEPVD